jgi:hypothetical protein
LSYDADNVCGAEYGQASPDRVNSRNGYRNRELYTPVGTPGGLPVGFAVTARKPTNASPCSTSWPTQPYPEPAAAPLIADKNYFGREFEAALPDLGVTLLRPARKGEPERPGSSYFKPMRQIIESINDTVKGQLDLDAHGARTTAGVLTRIRQRLLALTAAIWHNDKTNAPIKRALIAYDH